MEPVQFNLVVGWTSMLAGALSGAGIGLFFHNDHWLGGYATLRRRMVRLGHISFFGIGILNVLFAMSLVALPVPVLHARVGSIGLLVAAVMMPLSCFLTAWRTPSRFLFPIPVAGVLLGVLALLAGWATQ
jgi:hypothetical protein